MSTKLKLLNTFTEPGPPSNISITTLNLTSMAVSWQPPIELNGIIIGYNIVYNDNEIQVDGNVTMVTLNDLDCWTVYHVNVSARTLAGYGRESSAVGVTDVYGNLYIDLLCFFGFQECFYAPMTNCRGA